MSYKKQMEEWLARHPKAKLEEAYDAGYLKAVENWCKKERFTNF